MNGIVAWTEGAWKRGKYLSVIAGIDLILFMLLLLYNFSVIASYACCDCLK